MTGCGFVFPEILLVIFALWNVEVLGGSLGSSIIMLDLQGLIENCRTVYGKGVFLGGRIVFDDYILYLPVLTVIYLVVSGI